MVDENEEEQVGQAPSQSDRLPAQTPRAPTYWGIRDETAVLRRRAGEIASPLQPEKNAGERTIFSFRVGPTRFAMAAEVVGGAFVVPPQFMVPGMPAAIPGLLPVRGQLVAALDLATLLVLPAGEARVAAVAVAGNEMVAFLADDVEGLRSVTDQQIHAVPTHVDAARARYLRGMVSGMALLLDIEEIMRHARFLFR